MLIKDLIKSLQDYSREYPQVKNVVIDVKRSKRKWDRTEPTSVGVYMPDDSTYAACVISVSIIKEPK